MTDAENQLDALVVGAGPVGMALASELVRHGLRIRIVDKAAATKDYSRAPVFWPRAQEALDLMGIHALWDGCTVPMRRMHVTAYGQPAGVVALDAGDSAHPTPMMVGQDVTEGILERHMASIGAPVERSTEAVRLELHEDGATVTLKNADGLEERVSASWVIGCEGTNSLVREQVGIGWEGHALRGLMVPLADAQARWPLPQGNGDAYVALTNQGYFLTIPIPGMQRVIVAIPDVTPEGETPKATLEDVARYAAEALGGPVTLSDSPWVTVVRYGNYRASTFRKGRALLAGDAAHTVAPLSGQGMNTGVQDAFDLAWKLAYVHKGWAPEPLLDSYCADRQPAAEHLLRTTDRFFDIVLDPGKTQKALFRMAAPLGMKFRQVRDIVAAYYTELEVQYPDSPLNDDKRDRIPRPGQHVLARPLTRWPELTPLHLFDVLRGTHWTIIAFSGTDANGAALGDAQRRLSEWVKRFAPSRLRALMVIAAMSADGLPAASTGMTIALDPSHELHDAYHAASGALVLVRPDGYVAFHRGDGDRDLAAAQRLLHSNLGPAAA